MKLWINSACYWISCAAEYTGSGGGSHVHAKQNCPSRHQWKRELGFIGSLSGICLVCSLQHDISTCNILVEFCLGNLSGSTSRIQRSQNLPPNGCKPQPSLQDSIWKAKTGVCQWQTLPSFFHLLLHHACLLFLACCGAHTNRQYKRCKLVTLE